MPESRIARADRRSASIRSHLGDELRIGRLAAGLTLAQVARAVEVSPAEVSRIERGAAAWVPVGTLARIAAVVGLDLWVRTYPGGEPLRDAAQLALGDALRALVAAPLTVRSEVRVGHPRDLRAWDHTLHDPAGSWCGVELETRFVDAQAQHRRIARKLDDSATDRVLLIVADTRANRAAVRAASGMLQTAYAIEDPAAIPALKRGELPPRSALIFLPVARRPSSRTTRAGDT
jgi:transcriptional regulator with XRE-family HTH domain